MPSDGSRCSPASPQRVRRVRRGGGSDRSQVGRLRAMVRWTVPSGSRTCPPLRGIRHRPGRRGSGSARVTGRIVRPPVRPCSSHSASAASRSPLDPRAPASTSARLWWSCQAREGPARLFPVGAVSPLHQMRRPLPENWQCVISKGLPPTLLAQMGSRPRSRHRRRVPVQEQQPEPSVTGCPLWRLSSWPAVIRAHCAVGRPSLRNC